MSTTIRKIGMGLFTALACSVFLAGAADFSTWNRKMPVTFTGYSKTETLTNFPALVVLSTNIPGFSYSKFFSGTNADLRFTDATQTNELHYEVEKWDTNGISHVWVQVPSLADTNTAIWAFWGKSETLAPACTTNGATWSDGYVAVLHMSDPTNLASDSSPYRATGSVVGVTSGTGVVGRCGNFSGASYISLPNQAAYNSNELLTASIWVKCLPAGWALNYQMFMTKGVNQFWDLRRYYNTDQISFCLNNGNNVGGATNVQDGAWHLLTGVYRKSPADARLYLDGQLYATITAPALLTTNTEPLQISGRQGKNYNHRGLLDEVQVSRAYRSSDWVWASYMNQASNGVFAGSFNTYGSVLNGPLPELSNGVSQNQTDAAVEIVGTLDKNGGDAATVYLYWSASDGTNDAAAWTTGGNATNLGSVLDGTILTTMLTGLTPNTTYYWNYCAVNASGTVWAATAGSPSFRTLGPPAVNNASGATAVNAARATLNGNLTNGTSAHLYFYLWANGSPTTNAYDFGTQTEGAFSTNLTGLATGTTYYYQAYATNNYGEFLAPANTFTTPSMSAWYVATNGPVGGNGSSWVQAFTNIQTAIDTAADGDAIYLAAQTFTPSASELGLGKVIWTNKTLSILGGYAADGGSPGVVTSIPTTICNTNTYGVDSNRVLYASEVTNGTLARVKVLGGRIGFSSPQPGTYLNHFGAGIYMSRCTNMMLDGITLDDNAIGGTQGKAARGAGMYATNSWGTMTNCVIKNGYINRFYDTTASGSGLHIEEGSWLLRDCVVRDNTTGNNTAAGDGPGYGIGIYLGSGLHTLRNCMVSRNYARSRNTPQGEALYLAAGTATVENCTFYWHRFEGVRRAGGTLTLKNSIVWECGDDIAGTGVILQNCNIQDGDSNGVANCFSSDPLFERGLYLATNSPCVNKGSVSAVDAGLAARTTHADGAADSGTVDLGYHFAADVTDLYVSVNTGADSNPGTNSAVPFKTIGKALSVAGDGTHINVAAGNYTTNSETFPLVFPSNIYGVQLLGTNAAETVINAQQRNARVMQMQYNYPDARISGLTLMGADYQVLVNVTSYGAGLYAAHSRGVVQDCVIANNRIRSSVTWGAHQGGGLYMARSYFTISNCVIALNSAQATANHSASGGGISWDASDGLIDACTIVGNQAIPGASQAGLFGRGGGIYVSSDGLGVTIRNSLIASNNAADGSTSGAGSGIYNASAVDVLNCTITTNRATGVYGGTTAALTNCIVWGNGIDVTGTVSAVWSDTGVGPYTVGTGCISTNPAFVDPANGNFRLALGSPAVNAGTNQTWMDTAIDLDGNPRLNNSTVDQGAYEQITPVYIVNRNPSDVTASTATMNGSLLSTGASPTHVWLYWGPSDGTTNKSEWTNVVDFGVCAVGELTTNISFIGGSTFFYTFYASNEVPSESWGQPSKSFDVGGGISVVASSPAAAELGPEPGQFTISRPASSTGLPVTVNFTLTGAAVNGEDYQYIAPSVIIPAGESNLTVTVTPIIDRIVEGSEDVALTITAGTYLIDAPSSATVFITDWVAPTMFYTGAGGNSTYATNWATAFSNLQQAVDAAQNGDTIRLAAQTFTLSGATNGLAQLVWTNKSLSILGGYDTNGLAGELAGIPTTLYNPTTYAGNTNRILYLSGVTNGTLARLKLLGGRIGYMTSLALNTSFYGAGLYMANCTNMVLDSLVFDGNAIGGQQGGSAHGAGLYATNSWGTLTNALFRNNSLYSYYDTKLRGAGLYLTKGDWTVRDSIIRDNTASAAGFGLGVYLDQGTYALWNCAITRNDAPSASQGDALYAASAVVTAQNCTFYWHRSEGVRNNAGTVTLRDSIVWECGDDIVGTVTLQNCNTQDGDQNGSNANIMSDPLFERGLYLATNSPCVGTGSATAAEADLDGRTTRVDGALDTGTVDMGYHFNAGVTDLFVSVDAGSDANSGTQPVAPFKTIGKAVSTLADGGYIYVAAGNYTTNTETFPLVIANRYGAQVLGADPTQTVINSAGGNARAITMTFNYPDAAIQGLTVINANWSVPSSGTWGTPGTLGFGLYLSHVRGNVVACTVTNNRSSSTSSGYPAGALYAASSDLVISNCVASGNRSTSAYAEGTWAAGIAMTDVNADLINCVIGDNLATGSTNPGWGFSYGGGLYLNGVGTLRGCLIYGNSATGTQKVYGQGVYVAGGSWQFENCTIASNTLQGLYRAAGTVALTNCIVWGNDMDVTGTVSAAYSDIGTGAYTDGGQNLSIDPLFVGAVSNNYRLTRSSQCVDAGTNLEWMASAFDLDGRKRKLGTRPDMGAYEFPNFTDGTLFIFR